VQQVLVQQVLVLVLVLVLVQQVLMLVLVLVLVQQVLVLVLVLVQQEQVLVLVLVQQVLVLVLVLVQQELVLVLVLVQQVLVQQVLVLVQQVLVLVLVLVLVQQVLVLVLVQQVLVQQVLVQQVLVQQVLVLVQQVLVLGQEQQELEEQWKQRTLLQSRSGWPPHSTPREPTTQPPPGWVRLVSFVAVALFLPLVGESWAPSVPQRSHGAGGVPETARRRECERPRLVSASARLRASFPHLDGCELSQFGCLSRSEPRGEQSQCRSQTGPTLRGSEPPAPFGPHGGHRASLPQWPLLHAVASSPPPAALAPRTETAAPPRGVAATRAPTAAALGPPPHPPSQP
jgi:hypothetical protein